MLPTEGIYHIVNNVTDRWIAASDIGVCPDAASDPHRACSAARYPKAGERVRTPRICAMRPQDSPYAAITVTIHHDESRPGIDKQSYSFGFPTLDPPLYIGHNSINQEGIRGAVWKEYATDPNNHDLPLLRWWVNEVTEGVYTLEVPGEGLFGYTRTAPKTDSCQAGTGVTLQDDEECSCSSPSVGCVVLASLDEITTKYQDKPQVYWRFEPVTEAISVG